MQLQKELLKITGYSHLTAYCLLPSLEQVLDIIHSFNSATLRLQLSNGQLDLCTPQESPSAGFKCCIITSFYSISLHFFIQLPFKFTPCLSPLALVVANFTFFLLSGQAIWINYIQGGRFWSFLSPALFSAPSSHS